MTSILFEPFFQRALLAGVAVALVSGPVGCFIVWRRMATTPAPIQTAYTS